MDNLAIRVEKLGKQYPIGAPQTRYKTLREAVVEATLSPFRRVSSVMRGQASIVSNELFWALKDVSFEVHRGEVIGVIGHNGAGKSTLLKILSRITEPTKGYAEIHGRVGSLLEVGTGFHHELTGRENIYLNGAILGMKRIEIDRKFDEIVAFAEIEKFLDTPIKHYSSGMYVRLAFAVAAHLEPEILLVDEVLAVGDINFQKKCLGRMSEVAKQGRTVFLVSHNMAAILNLCNSGILLKNGSIHCTGKASDVVQQYLASVDKNSETSLRQRTDRWGNGLVRVTECKVSRDPAGGPVSDFMFYDEAYVVLTIEAHQALDIFVGVQVKDAWGQLVFAFNSRETGFSAAVEPGLTSMILHIPRMPFLRGRYILDATINLTRSLEVCDSIENVGTFEMHPKDIYGSSAPFTSSHGVVFVEHKWLEETNA